MKLTDIDQRFQIKRKVPEFNKINVGNMSSMKDVWTYLNRKYGKLELMSTKRIEDIH